MQFAIALRPKVELISMVFFKSISLLHIGSQDIVDEKLFRKFTNVHTLYFSLFNSPKSKFTKVFNAFANVQSIRLNTRDIEVTYGNEILDLIPRKCQNCISLVIDNRNTKLDFDFLFKLSRLKFLRLNLGYAMSKFVYLNLVKQLKYLDYLDVNVIKPVVPPLNKDLLSEFKKVVNNCLVSELKKLDHHFIIKIYTRMDTESFVRYLMKLKERDDEIDKLAELQMYYWSNLKHPKMQGMFFTRIKHNTQVTFLETKDHYYLNPSF